MGYDHDAAIDQICWLKELLDRTRAFITMLPKGIGIDYIEPGRVRFKAPSTEAAMALRKEVGGLHILQEWDCPGPGRLRRIRSYLWSPNKYPDIRWNPIHTWALVEQTLLANPRSIIVWIEIDLTTTCRLEHVGDVPEYKIVCR
jgi:hypothetical protein